MDGSTGHEEVTEEGAKEPIPGGSGILPYTKESRWITMSHMYEWAQRFQELYPNEMEVYYESDSFICYRLQQNVNSSYNLAIDYGSTTQCQNRADRKKQRDRQGWKN